MRLKPAVKSLQRRANSSRPGHARVVRFCGGPGVSPGDKFEGAGPVGLLQACLIATRSRWVNSCRSFARHVSLDRLRGVGCSGAHVNIGPFGGLAGRAPVHRSISARFVPGSIRKRDASLTIGTSLSVYAPRTVLLLTRSSHGDLRRDRDQDIDQIVILMRRLPPRFRP